MQFPVDAMVRECDFSSKLARVPQSTCRVMGHWVLTALAEEHNLRFREILLRGGTIQQWIAIAARGAKTLSQLYRSVGTTRKISQKSARDGDRGDLQRNRLLTIDMM